jgi:hypothetical protein
MEDFASDFTDKITKGFKPGTPYSDVTPLPSESPIESSIKYFRR